MEEETVGTLGTEALKKAVKFGVNLTNQIIVSGSDGFSWTDAFSFVDEISEATGVIKSGKEIIAELKDLTEEEKVELYTYIQAEFDLEDDKVEAIVEDSLNIAFSILSLVEKIKN